MSRWINFLIKKTVFAFFVLCLLTSCEFEKTEMVFSTYTSDLFETDDLIAELKTTVPYACSSLPRDAEKQKEEEDFFEELGEKIGNNCFQENKENIYFKNFVDITSENSKTNISLVRIRVREITINNSVFETVGLKIVVGKNLLNRLPKNRISSTDIIIKISVVNDGESDVLVTGQEFFLNGDSIEHYFNKKLLKGEKIEISLSELSRALILKNRSTVSFYVTRKKISKFKEKDDQGKIRRRETLKLAAAEHEASKGRRRAAAAEEIRRKQETAAAEESKRKREAAAAEAAAAEAAAAEKVRLRQEAAAAEKWRSEHACELFLGKTVRSNVSFPDVPGNPVVTVTVTLNSDRTLKEVKVVEASQYPEFDTQIVRGLRKSSPFPRNCPEKFTYTHSLR